jgi:formate--tetrahydrofolate ligase
MPLARIGEPDPGAVARGLENLDKHIENIRKFEQRCVVAINHFPTDTDEEIAAVRDHCDLLGLTAVVAKPFSEGGDGCRDLAETVWTVAKRSKAHFKPLYDWSDTIEHKISTVAAEMYGAEAVDYHLRARRDKNALEKLGYDKLPICIAKTQQSLSDNPALLGRPKDFLVTVREIQLAAGAGFLVPITGEILRMPGLPTRPLAEQFDLSDTGEIVFGEA